MATTLAVARGRYLGATERQPPNVNGRTSTAERQRPNVNGRTSTEGTPHRERPTPDGRCYRPARGCAAGRHLEPRSAGATRFVLRLPPGGRPADQHGGGDRGRR